MKYLLQFLKSISEKPELKMNIGNLSIAWYPSLIRHRGQLSQIESLAHMRYLILVLQTMLSNIDEIFQDVIFIHLVNNLNFISNQKV